MQPDRLQAEVRRQRDAAAQNSRNSSRPPSTDRPEPPKPKSFLAQDERSQSFCYSNQRLD